ncbi:hypothetical protein ACTAQJ_20310 [Arthrobacter sp. alpha11c]
MSVIANGEWQLVDRLAELDWLQEVVQAASLEVSQSPCWEQRDVIEPQRSRDDS